MSKVNSGLPIKKTFALSLAALGVVYGDIGTSPLYAINEIFFGHGKTPVTPENVLGAISLVIWFLTLVITIKYIIFVLRADNDGEGGVFALFGILNHYKTRAISLLMILLMIAAGFLFGQGIFTPAISVLAAIEGFAVASPSFQNGVIPLTLIVLTGLFAIQYKGTAKVGRVFGPIVLCWFVAIALLGLSQVMSHPEILSAFNPLHGFHFLRQIGFHPMLLVLGAVVLVVTGGEALFADMGHFGKLPIRLGWFLVVYPALLLNYLGQGAFLLGGEIIKGNNLFFSMVPDRLIYPMVVLATLASIIASQALISGAFSHAAQGIALGLFPRLRIVHTHQEHMGQIYIRFVNWSLYLGSIILVLVFKSSSALTSAYGLAVSGVMLTNSIALAFLARRLWKWALYTVVPVFTLFAIIDVLFLMAGSLKFWEGGFIPVTIGLFVFMIMTTWKWGRRLTFKAYSAQKTMTLKKLMDHKQSTECLLDRTVLIMAPKTMKAKTDRIPALMQLFWDRYGLVPKNLIFVDIMPKKVPYIHEDRYRVKVFYREPGKGSVVGVTVYFGFMETPNLESILESLAGHRKIALSEDTSRWLVHVAYEHFIPQKGMSLAKRIKLTLFLILRRLSEPGYYYYGLGNKVGLSTEIMPIKVR